ncbi:hypothetical protein LFT45_04510 [Arthrobacter sp. FW305-BF8]|uniref:hypothetical protein n=1 Tax=Arthrobacter sp. FW305-BF8 TaxID=2879617 RepID=UPI001F3F647A|nr:hypothetical protein [Arthrobacter sp. FW305-BF8]UKA55201.1 hypothetical protein LFT45_04510 [Arthrobacter sp. FW305-BF8]
MLDAVIGVGGVSTTAALLAKRRRGINEHLYRSVPLSHEHPGRWRRVEPWMTTFVNTQSGQIFCVVDGLNAGSVEEWLAQRFAA